MSIQNILELLRQSLAKIKNDNLNQINLNIKISSNSRIRVDILKEGNNLFRQFFNLGIAATDQNISDLKNYQNDDLIKDVSNLIVDDKDWILFYLSAYVDFCVDFYEFDSIGKEVLEIRSGYQFMIDLFKECNENIDDVLKTFHQEIGQDFDKKLLASKECDSLDVNQNEIPRSVPKNHCWWFWNK